MKTIRGWRRGVLAGFAALAGLAGCQTYYGGGTYPSPRYLEHPPTYTPPSPPFSLARELATQQAIAAEPEPGAPVGGLPPRVPAASTREQRTRIISISFAVPPATATLECGGLALLWIALRIIQSDVEPPHSKDLPSPTDTFFPRRGSMD